MKRFIALALSVFVAVSMTSVQSMEYEDIVVKNAVNIGGDVSMKAVFPSCSDTTDKVFAAVYDFDGRLTQVKSYDAALSVNIALETGKDDESIKLFRWNLTDGMLPIVAGNKVLLENIAPTPGPTVIPTAIPTSVPTPTPSPEPTPALQIVTVEPPTASVESGEVAYGTTVILSPRNAHLAYSINGGEFIYEFMSASITITEDMTITVKSWLDVLEPYTQYNIKEATYTYTVDRGTIPTPTPGMQIVTVEPPTASVESGEVAYGTQVTISPVRGHLAYSINGGEFEYSFFSQTITITEDMTITAKSWLDVLEPYTQYNIKEATYTYTVDRGTIPEPLPS